MILLLRTKSPDRVSRNEISFPKYTYESGIPPVLKDINNFRFYRLMETMLILALIAAVCMCSGGDVSGRGDETWRQASLSARTEASRRKDERIYRAVMKGMEKCEKGEDSEMTKIMKRAREYEPTIERFYQVSRGCLTNNDKATFQHCVCSILGAVGIVGNPALRKLVMDIRHTPVFRYFVNRALRKSPVQTEDVKKVSKFMVDVVNRLEKDSIPASDVLANPNSSSHKSGNNQKGVDGVQNKGVTAEFPKSREVDFKAAREGEQRCIIS
jgi:hypothetical protein